MSKRKVEFDDDPRERKFSRGYNKKYSLDSDDEEDDNETYLNDNDIEGEEEGESTNVGQERFTAFNMREEMEEGHFDKDGHFIWKNEKEVRDNWLDNIDWQKIQTKENVKDEKTLGEESDSESDLEPFEEIETYKKIITYMRPNETINKSLSRLGKNKKLSSIERLRRKKAGLLDSDNDVTLLTELANKILSTTGNMNIYQETYESISKKIENYGKKGKAKVELDMYADDFGEQEQKKLNEEAGSSGQDNDELESSNNEVMWEFKFSLDEQKVEGPYNSQQMLEFSNSGRFKNGAWARKCSEKSEFYSTSRIDFDLYI